MPEETNTQPTRRERELARHRSEALEAAERLLARQPYSSISVQEIAVEAEFSVGYLYKLFPSKDELYLALVELRKNEVLELIRNALDSGGDFTCALRELVECILGWLSDHHGFVRDNRAELMALFKRHRDAIVNLNEKDVEMHRPVVALFRRGIAEGMVEGESPERMASTFRTLIWGAISDDFHREMELPNLDAEHIVQIILRTYSPHWKEHE